MTSLGRCVVSGVTVEPTRSHGRRRVGSTTASGAKDGGMSGKQRRPVFDRVVDNTASLVENVFKM